MKRKKWYVGIKGTSRIAFATATEPTELSHGSYNAVVGPFRTKRGARFMAKYGSYNNPHCQTVQQAEKLAKKQEAEQHERLAAWGVKDPK